MMFPQYYNFPEKRLINHVIHSANVKNLDDYVLFCYLNDCCVSLNFKKNAEYREIGYICEVNNATHLEYEFDLITDKDFFRFEGEWSLRFWNVPFRSFWVSFNTLVIIQSHWLLNYFLFCILSSSIFRYMIRSPTYLIFHAYLQFFFRHFLYPFSHFILL